MSESTFIRELEKALRALPPAQRQDILDDYRSHISEARARGKSDELIFESLGDPKALARSFIAEYHVNLIREPVEGQKLSTSLWHMIRAFFIVISIIAFNFFFMLWPILFASILLFVAWLFSGFSLLLSLVFSLIVLVSDVTGSMSLPLEWGARLALSFYSLAGAGVAFLLCILLFYLSRWFVLGLLKYVKLNLNVIVPK